MKRYEIVDANTLPARTRRTKKNANTIPFGKLKVGQAMNTGQKLRRPNGKLNTYPGVAARNWRLKNNPKAKFSQHTVNGIIYIKRLK